jgi:hypothetical protein
VSDETRLAADLYFGVALVGVDGEWRGIEVGVPTHVKSVIETKSSLLVLWILVWMNPSLLTANNSC